MTHKPVLFILTFILAGALFTGQAFADNDKCEAGASLFSIEKAEHEEKGEGWNAAVNVNVPGCPSYAFGTISARFVRKEGNNAMSFAAPEKFDFEYRGHSYETEIFIPASHVLTDNAEEIKMTDVQSVSCFCESGYQVDASSDRYAPDKANQMRTRPVYSYGSEETTAAPASTDAAGDGPVSIDADVRLPELP